ncbi:unnamed protein product [Pedinophyceae sp. YPF-701]|nr:unnamed protein product [Pedinophyceae sp. YPF-701]
MSTVLSKDIVRALSDARYDRRKHAALGIEASVRSLSAQGRTGEINELLRRLCDEFAFSPLSNNRKGGLIGLAALAVGLGPAIDAVLPTLVPAVLQSFNDQDQRVRYYACEALYNICKIARGHCTAYFESLFDALCKLCADTDPSVRNAAQLLDRLLKDVVAEEATSEKLSREFLPELIPVLKERMAAPSPYVRQLLVSWLALLDTLPELQLVQYLPDLLDPLLGMLDSDATEIRSSASQALADFLEEIKTGGEVDVRALAHILGRWSSHPGACSESVLLTTLRWQTVLLDVHLRAVAPCFPATVRTALLSVSSPNVGIAEAARALNDALMRNMPGGVRGEVETDAILAAVAETLESPRPATALASLRWLRAMLDSPSRDAVVASAQTFVPSLARTVTEAAPEVVAAALDVMNAMAGDMEHFHLLLTHLMDSFRGPDGMRRLQQQGSGTIRKLCAHLGAERVMCKLAVLLEHEPDTEFAGTVVQTLGLILLTAPELAEMRSKLKTQRQVILRGEVPELLPRLFSCWCHSPGAVLSLCLLAEHYKLAEALLCVFERVEVHVDILVQLDRLVMLLETPVFTPLRLHLLRPAEHPSLVRALYSLVMLLPQSDAFSLLSRRLAAAPIQSLLHLDSLQLRDRNTDAAVQFATPIGDADARTPAKTPGAAGKKDEWEERIRELVKVFEDRLSVQVVHARQRPL